MIIARNIQPRSINILAMQRRFYRTSAHLNAEYAYVTQGESLSIVNSNDLISVPFRREPILAYRPGLYFSIQLSALRRDQNYLLSN